MNKNAFKRAKEMFMMIAAIMKLPEEMQAGQLAKLPPYESRGKNKGKHWIASPALRRPRPNKYDKEINAITLAEQQEWNKKVDERNALKASKRLPDGTVMVGTPQAV